MRKKAIITGITGQDGSYLAEFLLKKNYFVYGIIRRSSFINTKRIDHLYSSKLSIKDKGNLKLIYGDLFEPNSIRDLIFKIKPNEFYNLAAQSHVGVSFKIPEYTSLVNYIGVVKLLEIIKDYQTTFKKKIKFYQASTSEMFGNNHSPQSEKTEFNPCSPYAISKVAAHNTCLNYREAFGIFACSGILFNHESPRRDERFVTKKITKSAARIKLGLQKKIYLGNIYAKRDWGYAPEYVEAMWKMMQLKEPTSLVISTGTSYSVEYFAKKTFSLLGLDYKKFIETDKEYFRPKEVNFLKGNSALAKKIIGWRSKTNIDNLIETMVKSDFEEISSKNS